MQLASKFSYSEMMEIGRSIITQTDELLLSKPPLKITDIFKINIVPKESPLKVSDPVITCEGSEVNEVTVRAGDPPTTINVNVDINKVFKEANIIQKVLFQSRSMAYDILVLCRSLHDDENHHEARGIYPLIRELITNMIDMAYIYQDVENKNAEDALNNYIKYRSEYPKSSKYWSSRPEKRAERIEKGLHSYGLIFGCNRKEVKTFVKNLFDDLGGLVHGRLDPPKTKEVQISQGLSCMIFTLCSILIIYCKFINSPATSDHAERCIAILSQLFNVEKEQ